MANNETLAAIYSEGKTLSVYDRTSSAWLGLPGMMDFTINGGERTGRSAGTDSNRPTGEVGTPQAPTVEVTFKYVSSPNWDLVDNAFVNGTMLDWRLDTVGEVIQDFAAASTAPMATVSSNGTVSFTAGTPTDIDDFPLGGVIKVGNAVRPIVSVVESGGALTVKVSGSAISTAAAVTTGVSGERLSFRGKVLMAPPRQHGIAQQSEREGTLTIQSKSMLPAPTRIPNTP